MSERLSAEEQKLGALILGIVLVIGAAIAIAKSLFPYFVIGSGILLAALVISAIIEIIFRDHSYLDVWDYVSTYIGIAFIVVLGGMFITYFIGYSVGGTSLGQACTQVYDAFAGVDEQMHKAINQVVEENCKIISAENCELLRNTAKTAKTLQEVQDFADTLSQATAVTNTITKYAIEQQYL
jgi:hypothetical protein